MRIYDFPRSGNCYKVRLMLAMLGLKAERITVDSTIGEPQSEAFRAINPRGQIPVLEDGELVIWDSMAILVYLARQYGDTKWLPNDALGEARVMQWLALSENEIQYGIARARTVLLFNRPFNLEQCQAEGISGLQVMEQRLQEGPWLAGNYPTIADIACYPYVAIADDAGIALEGYPAVREWIACIEALPGYVPMDA